MKHLVDKRYVLRRNLFSVIGACLCVYFSYHLMAGHRSWPRLITLERQTARVEAEYAALKSEREALEERVAMLRPGSINRDLLEERARAVLGYRRADEAVLVMPSP